MLLLLSIVFGFAHTESTSEAKNGPAEVSTTPEEAIEAFDKMMAVLTHKRCVNCHPAGDRPRQGEDSHYHNFGVQRGRDNHGLPAVRNLPPAGE